MTTPYQREAAHERNIKRRYEKKGYNVMRSAGSKGVVDLIAWNESETILIASQHVPFTKYHMQDIRANAKIPNNGTLLYYWIENGVERVLDVKELDSYCAKKFGSADDDYVATQERLRVEFGI